MKNFIQQGDTLTVAAPAGGAISGMPLIAGLMVAVAVATVAEGQPVAVKTSGVFELPKVSALAIGIGDQLYWDAATKLVTKTAGGNTLIGYAVEAAANPSAVARVRLI